MRVHALKRQRPCIYAEWDPVIYVLTTCCSKDRPPAVLPHYYFRDCYSWLSMKVYPPPKSESSSVHSDSFVFLHTDVHISSFDSREESHSRGSRCHGLAFRKPCGVSPPAAGIRNGRRIVLQRQSEDKLQGRRR